MPRISPSGSRKFIVDAWLVAVSFGKEHVGALTGSTLHRAIIAISNFSITLVVARSLTPSLFGVFALLYVGLDFIRLLHGAIVSEPILYFAPGMKDDKLYPYIGRVVLIHLVLSVPMLLVGYIVGTASALFAPPQTSHAILALGLCLPVLLLANIAERLYYSQSRLQWPIAAGIVELSTTLVALFCLRQLHVFSIWTAVLALSIAQTAVILFYAFSLRRHFREMMRARLGPAQKTFVEHFNFGRWSFTGHLMLWANNNVFILLLPAMGNIKDNGVLRTLTTTTGPVTQGIAALGGLLLPLLVRKRTTRAIFWHNALSVTAVMAFLCALFGVAFAIFGSSLVTLMYGAAYTPPAIAVRIAGFLPLGYTLIYFGGSIARALGRPDRIVKATIITAIVVWPLGVLTMLEMPLPGALSGMVAALGLGGLLTLLLSSRVPVHPHLPGERFTG